MTSEAPLEILVDDADLQQVVERDMTAAAQIHAARADQFLEFR
jgi:hypothetical protein